MKKQLSDDGSEQPMTSVVKIYDSSRNPVREEIFIKLLSINLLQTSVQRGAQEKILD